MKTDIDEKCLEPLLHVLDESVPALTENEAVPCRELMEVLKEQSGNVDRAFELVNNDSNAAYQEWCNFINEIQIMKEVMDNMKADLENICTDTDLTIEVCCILVFKLQQLGLVNVRIFFSYLSFASAICSQSI